MAYRNPPSCYFKYNRKSLNIYTVILHILRYVMIETLLMLDEKIKEVVTIVCSNRNFTKHVSKKEVEQWQHKVEKFFFAVCRFFTYTLVLGRAIKMQFAWYLIILHDFIKRLLLCHECSISSNYHSMFGESDLDLKHVFFVFHTCMSTFVL